MMLKGAQWRITFLPLSRNNSWAGVSQGGISGTRNDIYQDCMTLNPSGLNASTQLISYQALPSCVVEIFLISTPKTLGHFFASSGNNFNRSPNFPCSAAACISSHVLSILLNFILLFPSFFFTDFLISLNSQSFILYHTYVKFANFSLFILFF